MGTRFPIHSMSPSPYIGLASFAFTYCIFLISTTLAEPVSDTRDTLRCTVRLSSIKKP